MHCFMCSQPAIGQCPVCWRFYCSQHGNRRCIECAHAAPELRSIPFQTTDETPIIVSEARSLEPVRSSALRRVIAVGAQQKCRGLILSLIAIEVYDDGFAVDFRLALADPSKSAEQLPGVVPILAASAAGSDQAVYFASPISAMGPPGNWYTSLRFAPPLRDTSSPLVMTVIKIDWLPLPPSSRMIEWPGPWTFDVTLTADAPR
jgi:hypothetical protein